MLKILITGGAGFIGSNLIRKINENKITPTVIDNLENSDIKNIEGTNIHFVKDDLSNFDLVGQLVRDVDVVVHLAAQGSVPKSIENPMRMFENNLVNSLNLLENCRKYGVKFIFASSSSVFGSNSKIRINENTKTNPVSPYGASKCAMEKIINSYVHSYAIETLVFRFFNVYGPMQNQSSQYSAVIPKFISKGLKGESLEIYGDGEQIRDFTFVKDVVEIIYLSIVNNLKYDKPINLAWGNQISINTIVSEIKLNISKSILVEYRSPRNGDILESSNDPVLIQSLFSGFQPTSFTKGLIETINWYTSN